jgi:hypothetical protein
LCSQSSFAFFSFSKKSFVPDFAIVHIFLCSSSSVIPIPLSSTSMIFFLVSSLIFISNKLSSHKKVVSVIDFNLALSIASDAFEIISLKNISLLE